MGAVPQISSLYEFYLDGTKGQALAVEILEKIKLGKMPLTALLHGPGFHSIFAYQIESVAQWLITEAEAYTVLGDPILQQLSPSQQAWFIERKGQILGPFSLDDLKGIKEKSVLLSTDRILNPTLRGLCEYGSIPVCSNYVAVRPQFFTNRRHRRIKMDCLVSLSHGDNRFSARSLEISLGGIGIYTKIWIQTGELLRLELDFPEGQLNFNCQVSVRSCQTVPGGFRCNLMFENLDRRSLQALTKKMNLDRRSKSRVE